jgi:hypothetical protein
MAVAKASSSEAEKSFQNAQNADCFLIESPDVRRVPSVICMNGKRGGNEKGKKRELSECELKLNELRRK